MEDVFTSQVLAATTADGTLSVVAGITTDLVRDIRRRHDMAPTAAAATGRLATGATLLGASLKGHERLSLQVVGDGPLGSVAADVSLVEPGIIGTRAYAKNPATDLPLNGLGKLDVGTAVGSGRLQVTKSYEIGQPYVGIVELRTGEIGDDLAGYLLNSQQIPSVVALGVLTGVDDILAAGGVVAQVMPNADESVFELLETHAARMPNVTSLILEGATPQDLINMLTGGLSLRSKHTFDVRFACRCSLERVEIALMGLGKDELEKLAEEQPHAEATCEFCRKIYHLSSAEVLHLARRLSHGG